MIEIILGIAILVCLALLVILSKALRRAPAPAREGIDGETPIPTRYEYKIMLMLVTGEKDLNHLTATLFPLSRTLRGEIPDKTIKFLRALLGPMLARGWVSRVDKGNPGYWWYEIEDVGYRALKRVEVPPIDVWPPRHTRPARR